jgi:S-formylglutathione hydrolase FrmB
MNDPGAPRPPAPARQGAGNSNGRGGRAGSGFANVLSAQAAAWSPNPQNPPKFFDLPNENGVLRPEIAAKWIANSPLALVDQYATNLKKLRAIMMDCGLQDGLIGSNQQMDASLTRMGIAHRFETYEGDHTNRVKERFETKVLPFFSENLAFSELQSAKR